ncbi:MAG: TIGR02281 family clan AA aspartic protease [Pseudomonadota bacterium]
MLGRTLIFAAAVFCFTALVVPMSPEDEAAEANGAPKKGGFIPKKYADKSANSGWYGGDHTLTRQSDGHFYASATVEGVPVRMMVDTGASVIALTGRDASAIGIQWDEGQVGPIGRGASGAVYGVNTRLDEVEIGGITRRNVSAVIIPQGLDVSLLGQSYLSQLDAVEIANNQMVMSGG